MEPITQENNHRIAQSIVSGMSIADLCKKHGYSRNEMIELRYSEDIEKLVNIYSRDAKESAKYLLQTSVSEAVIELVKFLGLDDIGAREEIEVIKLILHYTYKEDPQQLAEELASHGKIKGGKRATTDAVKAKLLKIHNR